VAAVLQGSGYSWWYIPGSTLTERYGLVSGTHQHFAFCFLLSALRAIVFEKIALKSFPALMSQ
jgi:hypothetical protein